MDRGWLSSRAGRLAKGQGGWCPQGCWPLGKHQATLATMGRNKPILKPLAFWSFLNLLHLDPTSPFSMGLQCP